MTDFKFSNKFHIFLIISSVLIAIGIAVGLVCQFVFGGFFNFGEEYASYKTVTVSYAYVDYSDDDKVVELCDKEFEAAGVSYYDDFYGETTEGGTLTFKFYKSCDSEKLQNAAASIDGVIKSEGSGLSEAEFATVETELGSGNALIYCAIALSAAVAFQFIYFAIRYNLNGACAAFLANVHNLLLYLALMAITRVPFGSAAFAFGVITVLATVISSCYYFDRVRKNSKSADLSRLTPFELCDLSARESFFSTAIISVGLAAAGLLLFVTLSISSLSAYLVLSSALGAVFAALSCIYGTAIFTPSVHARFKKIADNFKATHGRAAKAVKA